MRWTELIALFRDEPDCIDLVARLAGLALKTLLREKRIPCEVAKTGQDGVTEFLVVDVEQDFGMASDLTKLVLQNLCGFHEDVRVELYFSGVSPKDERIGFS